MNYWKLSEKDNLCTYFIMKKQSILIVNIGKEEKILEAITNKKFKSIEIYSFKSIKEIILIDNKHKIDILRKDDDDIDRNVELDMNIYFEIKSALTTNMRGVEVKDYSIYKQIAPNIVIALIVGVLTFMTYIAAVAIENGESLSVSGRRALVKRIIVRIAELLGPIGSIILGVSILIVVTFLIIKKIKNPKVGNVIKFKNQPELIMD